MTDSASALDLFFITVAAAPIEEFPKLVNRTPSFPSLKRRTEILVFPFLFFAYALFKFFLFIFSLAKIFESPPFLSTMAFFCAQDLLHFLSSMWKREWPEGLPSFFGK